MKVTEAAVTGPEQLPPDALKSPCTSIPPVPIANSVLGIARDLGAFSWLDWIFPAFKVPSTVRAGADIVPVTSMLLFI